MTRPQQDARITVAFVGFGDLASRWSRDLLARAGVAVRAYLPGDSPSRGSGLAEQRAQLAGLQPDDRLEPVLAGADVVFAAVPSAASTDAAARSAPHLEPGTLYVDPSSSTPETKAGNAAVVGAAGALYVDAAVLGTATLSGIGVPVLAAGPGASRFAEMAAALSMDVTDAGSVPGDAARAKLIRSVYMKGRDALLVEMLAAAEAAGVAQLVIESIAAAPGERVPFDELVERVLPALTLHAGRRADELRDAAATLEGLGVSPAMTAAGADRLRWMAGRRETASIAGGDLSPTAADVIAALGQAARDGSEGLAAANGEAVELGG